MKKDHGIDMDIPTGRTPGAPPPGPPSGAPAPTKTAPPKMTIGQKLSPEFFRDVKKALSTGLDNDGQPFTSDDAREIFEVYKARRGADPVSVAAFEKVIGGPIRK